MQLVIASFLLAISNAMLVIVNKVRNCLEYKEALTILPDAFTGILVYITIQVQHPVYDTVLITVVSRNEVSYRTAWYPHSPQY